jgi:hypothetical protein
MITLVLYIGSLPNLTTWFPCGRGRTLFILGSLGQSHCYYKYNFWQQGRFRTITLVLYIESLANLATWFLCGREITLFILRSLGQRSRSPLLYIELLTTESFPHDSFSSVYWIFTKLGHIIPLWKGKNPIYFGVITIIPFDKLHRRAYFVMHTFLVRFLLIYVLKYYVSFNQKWRFMTLLPTWPNVLFELLPSIYACHRYYFTFRSSTLKLINQLKTNFGRPMFVKSSIRLDPTNTWPSSEIVGSDWLQLSSLS